jgi:hypothetical protein
LSESKAHPAIALLIITDGRKEYLERTLNALRRHIDPATFSSFTILNDCPDPTYQQWLDDSDIGYVIPPDPNGRRGFGGAIREAWQHLHDHVDSDFIFHLEDDFVLQRDVDLRAMARVLDEYPHLAQIVLRRQPWNEIERSAGSLLNVGPEDFKASTNGLDHWLEHRRYFSTNPCLYPWWMTTLGWPEGLQSEGRFSLRLFQNPQLACAFWGQRDDEPWVHHIGEDRTGRGY